MKRIIHSGICVLIILLVLFPVFGDSLKSAGNGTASGSTSVTAKIELPEDSYSDDAESTKTGDASQPFLYVSIMVGSIIIVAMMLKKRAKRN